MTASGPFCSVSRNILTDFKIIKILTVDIHVLFCLFFCFVLFVCGGVCVCVCFCFLLHKKYKYYGLKQQFNVQKQF